MFMYKTSSLLNMRYKYQGWKQSSLDDIAQPSIVITGKIVFQPGALLFWKLIAKSVIEYSDERTFRAVEKNWVKSFSTEHAITLRVGTVNRIHNKCMLVVKSN